MSAESWVPSLAARPIWQLASGYASARRRRHPLWMLEAYFDDSGSEGGPVLVLAGWLSTAERWANFNEEWQAILAERPEIAPFKMQHAMTWHGGWRPMEWNDRGELLERFHEIIMRHAIRAFASVVHRGAFDELVRRGLKGHNVPKTAYWLAFMGVIHQTMEYHRSTGATEKVDFVFDEQGREFEHARDAFGQWRQVDPNALRYVAGTPREANDREVLPLQAADYLVWQVRRKVVATRSGKIEPRPLVVRVPGEDWSAELARDTGKNIETPSGTIVVPPMRPVAETLGFVPLVVDEWDQKRLEDFFRSPASDASRIAASARIDRA